MTFGLDSLWRLMWSLAQHHESPTVVEVSRYSIPGIRLEPDFWAQG